MSLHHSSTSLVWVSSVKTSQDRAPPVNVDDNTTTWIPRRDGRAQNLPTAPRGSSWRMALLAVAGVLLLGSCTGGGATAPRAASPPTPTPRRTLSVWAFLARQPLHLPVIPRGGPCPVSRLSGLPPNHLIPRPLWFASPSYHGPILIRGRQVDGPHGVRFNGKIATDPAPTDLHHDVPGQRRVWASILFFRAPGATGSRSTGLGSARWWCFKPDRKRGD